MLEKIFKFVHMFLICEIRNLFRQYVSIMARSSFHHEKLTLPVGFRQCMTE